MVLAQPSSPPTKIPQKLLYAMRCHIARLLLLPLHVSCSDTWLVNEGRELIETIPEGLTTPSAAGWSTLTTMSGALLDKVAIGFNYFLRNSCSHLKCHLRNFFFHLLVSRKILQLWVDIFWRATIEILPAIISLKGSDFSSFKMWLC